ncbi:MAG: M1 family metallopeptidase [Ferruginibacter sp.]|nr:M1 family metallopeptidase [Bacteroidota bacterium]MBX2917907.1 M1 family metallopeptidase [Ferruginibacter sp.]
MKKYLGAPLLLFMLQYTMAQTTLPIPLNIQRAYDKGTRSMNGKPGKNYWQNHASYDIAVNFQPSTRLVSGTEEIKYTNNSPDTLKTVVFKLYPNIYKKGSPRLMNIHSDDVTDGVQIEKILADEETIDAKKYHIDATNMMVKIKPLAPGQTIKFTIGFSYTLNKKSHIRTGEVADGAYFIAYYFPRIAVYDDIDGWNMNPYLGTQEFYNDFCHFKTSITVPGNYIVWATGDLKNAADLFESKYLQRILQAQTGDAVIIIIDSNDVKTGGIVKPGNTHTWVFEADNVTDAVFALSNHYVWQSSSLVVDKATGRRTRVDAVFNPIHKDYFNVASDAHKTIEAMSYRFPKWPYPYSHETVFDGLDQMEYPMMVNDNPVEDRAESIELTTHEIFHTMFPFYMGINETKYGWMDEGWATIGEWLISPMIDSSIVDLYGVAPVENTAGNEIDMPIVTLTTQENGTAMFINSYPKPAMGYLFVKDMLGDDLFYKGLHNYFRNWAGKHPIPYDFFFSMNEGSGKNLDWFWKRWFFDDGVPDLAIAKVVEKRNKKQVTIQSKGAKPVPVDITVIYTDGSTQQFHQSIAVWEKGNTLSQVNFTSLKKIKLVKLGSSHVPDINKKDNEMEVK